MMPDVRSLLPWRGDAARRALVTLAVSGTACLAYLRTMPPGLVGVGRGLWDSQETQAVGVTWGYLHPPGYPLQSLLANLLAHTVGALPGVEPGWAVTLLSVLAMVLAVGFLFQVARRLTGHDLPAALAAVVFAFSPGPWRTAITPEVYALNLGLWTAVLWLTLRAAGIPSPQSHKNVSEKSGFGLPRSPVGNFPIENVRKSRNSAPERLFPRPRKSGHRNFQICSKSGFSPKGIYGWLGLALGLAAGHHRTAVLLIPAVGLYLGIRQGRSVAWGRLLAGMILSAAVYLYLPLAHLPVLVGRPGWHSPLTPGDATSLAGFWELVSARAWAVFFRLPADVGELSSRLGLVFDALADQLGIAVAGLGSIGLGWLVWRRPARLALLGLPVLGLLAFAVVYQVPDVATMLGPLVMLLCLGLAGLVAGVWELGPFTLGPRLSAIGWLLVVGVGGGLLVRNYPLVDESWDRRGQAVIAELACELSDTPGDTWLTAESGYAGPLVTYLAERLGRPLVWANPWAEWDYLAALAEGRRIFLVKDMPGTWQYPDALTRLAGPGRYLMPTGSPDLLELVDAGRPPLADLGYVSLDHPFGLGIFLRGYTFRRCQLEEGQVLRLTLYWEGRERLDQDWRVKAHLFDGDGTLLVQADSEHPARGARPTTRWQPGEVVRDVHDFRLPPGVDPSAGRVVVGLYQIAGDEFPSLGEVEIAVTEAPYR